MGGPHLVPYHLVTEEALHWILMVLVPSAASALLLYLWPLSLFSSGIVLEKSARLPIGASRSVVTAVPTGRVTL